MKGDTNFGAALSISTASSGTFRVTRTFCFAEEAILRTWLALEKFLQINPRDSLAKWVYTLYKKREDWEQVAWRLLKPLDAIHREAVTRQPPAYLKDYVTT